MGIRILASCSQLSLFCRTYLACLKVSPQNSTSKAIIFSVGVVLSTELDDQLAAKNHMIDVLNAEIETITKKVEDKS